MDPMEVLRSYQMAAIVDTFKRWDAGATRVPIVLATGLGKTKIFTRVVWKWLEDREKQDLPIGIRHKRALVIAHTDELIEQAAREMRLANPGYSVGIVKAGLNETHARIIVSSRQTLASEKRRAAIRNVGLIVVDECHHALRSNTYGKILEHFGAFAECTCCPVPDPVDQKPLHSYECASNPGVKVLGVTATLARGDKGKLSTVWEEVTFRKDILFGIRHGFLLDVRGERVIVPDLNMSNVKKSGGDFQDASLAEELERTFAPQIIADKYAEVARDVRSNNLRQGIAFWPLVETAYHGAAAFEDAGISSAVIHGGLPKEERKLILKRFRAGEITMVHNCMVLTEGFDAPWADVVVIARPTKSAPLYQQMVGRVLRPDLTVPAEQREKALILDVTGAGATNDLRSLIDLSPERPLSRDDEEMLSLLELDEMFELEEINHGGSALIDGDEPYVGETTTVAFDPLHRESLWAETPEGTFYMSAGGNHYVFLFEGEPARWDVVWCQKRGGAAGLTEHTSLSLEDALAYGEDAAFEMGGVGSKSLAKRKAPWRRGEVSDPQRRLAMRLGIWRDGMTKGECSEAIDAANAAKTIDPLVRVVRAGLAK